MKVIKKSTSAIFVSASSASVLQASAFEPYCWWPKRASNLLNDFTLHSWVCLNECRLCPTDVVRTSTNITCTSHESDVSFMSSSFFPLSIMPWSREYDIRILDVNSDYSYISHHAVYRGPQATLGSARQHAVQWRHPHGAFIVPAMIKSNCVQRIMLPIASSLSCTHRRDDGECAPIFGSIFEPTYIFSLLQTVLKILTISYPYRCFLALKCMGRPREKIEFLKRILSRREAYFIVCSNHSCAHDLLEELRYQQYKWINNNVSEINCTWDETKLMY